MALIKFGALITSGSGSLGGHTIQHSKGGMQLRTKPIPPRSGTVSQTAIRSINPILQAGWRALTDSQREIWNDWPVTHGIFNANGDKHPLSGHSLWMKYNFVFAISGRAFKSDPYSASLGPYGPNLWTNSTFNVQPPWSFFGNVNINGGTLNFGSVTWNRAYAPAIVTLGLSYFVEFDLTHPGLPANLLLRGWENISLFNKFAYETITYPAGHYSQDIVCVRSSINAGFFQEFPRNGYSVDNVSLRQIL